MTRIVSVSGAGGKPGQRGRAGACCRCRSWPAVQEVGGASVIQQLLAAGLVNELHIDIMPVCLGGGLRLFEHLDPALVRLQKHEVQEVGARASLRFRVGH